MFRLKLLIWPGCQVSLAFVFAFVFVFWDFSICICICILRLGICLCICVCILRLGWLFYLLCKPQFSLSSPLSNWQQKVALTESHANKLNHFPLFLSPFSSAKLFTSQDSAPSGALFIWRYPNQLFAFSLIPRPFHSYTFFLCFRVFLGPFDFFGYFIFVNCTCWVFLVSGS